MRIRQAKQINDLFGDHRFKDKSFSQEIAYVGTDSGLLRLVLVVFPVDEITMCRLELDSETKLITTNFKFALRTFRELI